MFLTKDSDAPNVTSTWRIPEAGELLPCPYCGSEKLFIGTDADKSGIPCDCGRIYFYRVVSHGLAEGEIGKQASFQIGSFNLFWRFKDFDGVRVGRLF